MDINAPPQPDTSKAPRTQRGRKTLRKLLDAAEREFGERGYHEASVSSITRRAGVALGSFYTYFNSKEELFTAVVRDMSGRVGTAAGAALKDKQPGLARERAAFHAFLDFVRAHKEIYRIIDEAEFVDPASYREHYETTARRIAQRLSEGAEAGALRPDVSELHAWAIMGMNVFLGLRYGVWDKDTESDWVATQANSLLANGIGPAKR